MHRLRRKWMLPPARKVKWDEREKELEMSFGWRRPYEPNPIIHYSVSTHLTSRSPMCRGEARSCAGLC